MADSKATDDGRTPLNFAAEEARGGIVKLPLAYDVETDSKAMGGYYKGLTPHNIAAEKGHEGVVQRGADADSRACGQPDAAWLCCRERVRGYCLAASGTRR